MKKEFSWSDTFVWVKFVAFVIFVSLSAFISINLFMHLSSDPFDQYVMLAFAIALELLKVYLLIRANTLNRVGLKKKAWTAYGIYAGSILISVIASFGFTLTVLDRSIQESSSSPTAITLQQTKDEIQQHKDTIAMYQNSITTANDQIKQIKDQAQAFADQQKKNAAENKPVLTKDFNPAITKLSNIISSYQTKIQDESEKIPPLNEKSITLASKLATEVSDKKNTSNMFELMANTLAGTFLAIKEASIQLLLLILIAALIEVGIIICSPSITIDREHIYHFLGEDLSKDEIDKIKLELFGPDPEIEKPVDAVILQEPKRKRQARKKKEKEPIKEIEVPEEVSLASTVDDIIKQLEEEPKAEEVLNQKQVEDIMSDYIPVEETPLEIKPEAILLDEDDQLKTRPTKDPNFKYIAGTMTQPEMTHLLRFVDELFGDDPEGRTLIDKDIAAKRAEIPAVLTIDFFNILKKVIGKTGLPMITISELDANNTVWSACYNLQATKAHLSTVISRGAKK